MLNITACGTQSTTLCSTLCATLFTALSTALSTDRMDREELASLLRLITIWLYSGALAYSISL